jgi:bifunctional non-homologous end joining protein LigD
MGARRRAAAAVSIGGVRIGNADKVWWPDDGVTKGDVAAHYARVAHRLLPWTTDRPLTVERCPDGMLGRCFYQKNFPPDFAAKFGLATRAIRAASVGRTVHYPVADNLQTLLALVNLGGLSLHLMNCRASTVEQPDWLAFDLDPAERFADAARAAWVLRAILNEIGLHGYPKTTGGKGLHVLVPLRPGAEHAAVLAFARAVGERMVAQAPRLATLSFARRERGGRLYVDLNRNVLGATIVAPYSVRRRPHAPVSTPLAWDEVRPDLDPATFTVRTLAARLAGPDPWSAFWSSGQSLPRLATPAPSRRRTVA